MAENRRAQLELWRQERQREKQPVQTTTVAVQRRVVTAPPRRTTAKGRGLKGAKSTATSTATSVVPPSNTPSVVRVEQSNESESRRSSGESRATSLDSASGDGDATDPPPSAEKPRKEKRRTSFILPSPSNVPSLAGGAKRVLTPTRLTPPKADEIPTTTTVEQRMLDSDESDGGFGPSPRKKRVIGHAMRVVTVPVPDDAPRPPDRRLSREEDVTKTFDDGETDADARSVRTTLSFGAISGPLRVLHGEEASDDDMSEFGSSQHEEKPSAETKSNESQVPIPHDPPPISTLLRVESDANETLMATRSGPPQRVAMRVLASGTAGSLGPPRRTSTGEASGRKSLDDPKPTRTLEERLEERRNWEMEDFVVTKNLGKGKFGNVYLAKEKHSNVSVALKVLYKSPLILEGGLKNLQREVEIQHRLLHPNLLRLFGYFYDESCVYLILEFASHGELYKLLSKQHHFSEAFAAHYIAQVVDALEYLHGCHVIHRDIKPENLLMGPNHTIKLADFGWSVHAPQQFSKRRTFCGTPDYLSPEVLLCEEYDHRVDVWSVGVLAYEFLFGSTPFHVENQMEMYKRIENVDFQFPSEPAVSESAKKFISSLLKRNPDDRMTLTQAKTHEWLARRPSI